VPTILVEKPLAADIATVDRMMAACERWDSAQRRSQPALSPGNSNGGGAECKWRLRRAVPVSGRDAGREPPAPERYGAELAHAACPRQWRLPHRQRLPQHLRRRGTPRRTADFRAGGDGDVYPRLRCRGHGPGDHAARQRGEAPILRLRQRTFMRRDRREGLLSSRGKSKLCLMEKV